MSEPYLTDKLRLAITVMGHELESSYTGVLKEVSRFIAGFKMCDAPLLVAALESATTAMKDRFDDRDDALYKIVTIPGTTVIMTTKQMREGEDRGQEGEDG
jgi:hypothetical protein